MKPFNVIYQTERYRIVECFDSCTYRWDELKGDCYDPKHNPDIDPAELKQQERDFEDLVRNEGVFGYELQRWNPNPDCGWEHVDSCFGFVGRYSETDERFNHYIVAELKAQIPKGE